MSSASSDPGGDPEDRAPSPVRLEGLLLADLLEQAHDAIVVKDEAHRVVFWNRGAEALYGWSRSEALGRVTHDLLQTAFPVPLDAIAEEMERKGFWEGELVHRGRSGIPIVVESRWVVRRNGAAAELMEINRDVTERKEYERALRETQERYRSLFENATEGMFHAAPDGRLLAVNPALARFLGYESPDELSAHVRHVAQLWGTGEPGNLPEVIGPIRGRELEGHRRDGSRLCASVDIVEVGGGSGGFGGYQGMVVDVTERKAVEERLRRAREEADQANRAKTEFLSRMTHELRTPLTAILGFGQLLRRRALAAQEEEYTDLIVSAGKHLLDLVNEILDLTRIEQGKLPLSPEPVRIGDVTDEAVGLLGPMASQRGIVVSSVGEGADCHVMADRQRLGQVLLNLLSNAVKHNIEGGTVAVSSAVEGERVVIAVRDTGPGIAPEFQPLAFEPFERAGREQGTVEGTGLGLTLARRLVEAMGGSVGLRSAPGQGSTFWFELPLVVAPGADLSPDETGVPGDAQGGTPHQSTVLYVEDNLSNVKLMERLLALRTGIKLIPAMQGSLGLELAREHHPDLILLDLNLPDASGAEILARLRGDATTADIPVVVLSADATRGQVERLLSAGARAYLTKPFDLDEFLKLLDETVGTPGVET